MHMKKILQSVFIALIIAAPFVPQQPVYSASQYKQISLRDLGILQVAAHDLFNVDRHTDTDTENGKLDLSTVFDYGEANIAQGGEIRNKENIIVATVAQDYGNRYERFVRFGWPEERARSFVVRQYHNDVRRAYTHAFGEAAPAPRPGQVTMTENLALRTIHDYLPGEIRFNGKNTPIIDLSFSEHTLDRRDLNQKTSPLDGQYDEAFRNMVLEFPFGTLVIDLLEKDSTFADQFSTDHSFEFFLEELENGRYDRDDVCMTYIRSVIGKGLYLN